MKIINEKRPDKYPVSLFIVIIMLLISAGVVFFGLYDMNRTLSQNSIKDSVLQSQYYPIKEVNSPPVARLYASIQDVKVIKDVFLADAMDYYFYLYVYTVLLGISSILGSVILLNVIRNGWQETTPDIKFALRFLFVACSICYFIPRLMDNQKNYKKNLEAYCCFERQFVYSVNVMTGCHGCKGNDTLDLDKLCVTADSNFNTIIRNYSKYYDINSEAASNIFSAFDKEMQK